MDITSPYLKKSEKPADKVIDSHVLYSVIKCLFYVSHNHDIKETAMGQSVQ